MYAAAQPRDAKTDVALLAAPGLTNFATCGVGPVRGMHEMGDALYAVSGNYLYSVQSDGTTAQIGGQIGGAGRVAMDDNGSQLAIVNGENGYIYSTDGGFQLITDTNFHPAQTTSYIDGVFAYDRSDTNEFFISDSLDGLTYSDFFASAEWKSDNIVAVLNHLEQIYLLGQRTIEPWYASGAANFPFQRIEGAAIDRGIIGPHAAISESQKIYIIGDDRVGYTIAGGGLAPITTEAIDQAWQGYSKADDAHVFSYSFDGHRFVCFTFPTIPASWQIDLKTGLWHERVSWDENGRSLGRWRGNCAILAFGKTLIGDAFSGKIGYLDAAVATEYGNTVQAELVLPPLHGDDGQRVFMPYFEIDVESGVGLSSGQGSDPQIMLDISDDGGRTFVDQQPWRSMGRIGEYRQRLRWDRLGSFYDRSLRLTISDPVRRTIIAARCPGMRAGSA